MKVALLSDVHANLPALDAVLDAIRRRGEVDATYHLGDLVGYAPWPDETVALIREAGIAGVAGNYDSTTATGYEHCGCRYEDPAQEALSHLSYAWKLEHTSPETRRRLGSLPFRLDVRPLGGHRAGPTLILVHGAPTSSPRSSEASESIRKRFTTRCSCSFSWVTPQGERPTTTTSSATRGSSRHSRSPSHLPMGPRNQR